MKERGPLEHVFFVKSGPDGLRVTRPQSWPTERFEPVHGILGRSHGDPDGSRGKKKGLLKIDYLANMEILVLRQHRRGKFINMSMSPGFWDPRCCLKFKNKSSQPTLVAFFTVIINS